MGMTDTPISELVSDLHAMGIDGRHVMVHSSFKTIRPVENGPQGVVEAFVQAVGDGVLLFPTFDFESWSERGYWERNYSASRMGVITEMARLDDRFVRTSHPMLSFAIYHGLPFGRSMVDPPGYVQDVPNAHGAGSVFDRFIQNDGLLISIGADQQTGFKDGDVGFTASVHAFVEAGVDWRYMKVFEGVYVDGGVASIRKYAASVTRDPKRFQTAVTAGHLEGERLGIIKRMKLGRTVAWLAEAKKFHEFAVESCIKKPELWRHVL